MTESDSGGLALWYRQPAASWLEALPIGNGRLGAMVFGGAEAERLQLNDDTLWSGGPREWDNPAARERLPELRRLLAAGDYAGADALCRQMQGTYTQSYQPLGVLLLGFELAGAPSDYRRELDLRTALATTRFRIGAAEHTRAAFASAPDQVLVVRVAADRPGQISFTARLASLHPHQLAAGVDTCTLSGRAPSHVAPDYQRAAEPIVYDGSGAAGLAFVAGLAVLAEGGRVSAESGRLRVEGADAATLIVATATSYGGADPATRVNDQLAAARGRGYAALLAGHLRDHAALFERVALDLGSSPAAELSTDERLRAWPQAHDPQLAALLFQYGRYLLIASSRPGTQPANLQGIWNDKIQPPWSSNWTLNINAQMNYWAAESTNLAECHAPLFDLIAGLSATGARTAASNYGCRGWVAHHNTDLWRQSAPVGDFGAGDPVWAFWPMAGPWLCQHLWEHFLFGGDEQFLRERAYPLMRGAAEFCLDWLVEDGRGRLVTAPATSPENRFRTPKGQVAAVSVATTLDMALIWDLFSSCIAAGELLGEDAKLRAELVRARERLLPPGVGAAGQLREWSEDWDLLAPEPQHRHISHLFGLHPGRQITRRDTPELFAAARCSLELRGDGGTGWSLAWKVNVWARLGEGDRAYAMLAKMLTLVDDTATNYAGGGGVYANLLGAHPPYQIDGNFGATAGVAELLLQSHAGAIELLPALPRAWPSGSAHGLRARGGFTLGLEWRAGRLAAASLHSARGGLCRLRTAEPVRVSAAGAPLPAAQIEPGLIQFATAAGQTYTVMPQE